MKEPKLKIIVVLMTVAVIGLIAIQYYWISTLVKTEENRFDKNVNEALQAFVAYIDENEAKENVVAQIAATGDKALTRKITGHTTITTNKPVRRTVEVTTNAKDTGKIFATYSYVVVADAPVKEDSIHIIRGMKQKHSDFKIITEGIKKNKATPENYTMLTNGTGRRSSKSKGVGFGLTSKEGVFTITSSIPEDTVKIETLELKKRELVNTVVNDMLSLKAPEAALEKLNRKKVDSLLAKSMNDKGITISFAYKIKPENKDTVLLSNAKEEVMKSAPKIYAQDIFPLNPFMGNKAAISVAFPGQKAFIYNKVLWMFVLSIALLLIIISVFYYTVKMFLKQKKISQVKSDLINNITHEFKTPIATISLACDAIVEPGIMNDGTGVHRYSKMIKEENSRLGMMVENLLSAAAIEKGEYSINKEEIDIHELILKTSEKFSIIFRNAKGKLTLNLQAERAEITADSFHMTNIINNLLDNAFKYGGECPEAAITTSNSSDGIYIVFEDRGIGIPAKELNKIFDTFYRVPTGNIHDVPGTGIGLSYVKKLVEEHKGNISVESEENSGSKFTLFLPFE